MTLIVSIIYSILKFLDKFLSTVLKKKYFINHLFDELYIQNISEVKINNKSIKFWTPGNYSKYMIDNFLQKEKLVEKFILDIPDEENVIFWDIGANLGIYSLFCATYKDKVKTIAFECSPSAVLAISKNISLNKLEDKISIFQLGLTNYKSGFLTLKEDKDSLGDQFISLGKNFEFENNQKHNEKNKYKIFSNSIFEILNKNMIEIPNYIKLDVGTFELEVLEGFGNYLNNPKIKSIITEMKYGSKKVGSYVFDQKKLEEKSNKIYELFLKAGFKSQHLENNNKKEGWYLDIFYR